MTRKRGIYLDVFAGGGGASTAMKEAGCPPDVALNHDPEAIAVHKANHPDCRHICQDVFEAKPLDVTGGEQVDGGWFSPDCTHFSPAKGGKPLSNNRRALAWVVRDYARDTGMGTFWLENIPEFEGWGPLLKNGRPDRRRMGETFTQWVNAIEALGYRIGWDNLVAADYGAPTTRKRLFLCGRRDDAPIVTPERSHARGGVDGKQPWRTAAEIIDFNIPCPSIFMTREEAQLYYKLTGIRVKRPLAAKTMLRILAGMFKFGPYSPDPFVLDADVMSPFITKFRTGSTGSHLREPLHTITANSFHKRPGGAVPLGLVTPFVSYAQQGGRSRSAGVPFHTFTASAKDQNQVITAFLAQHNNGRGVDPNPGRSMRRPLSAFTETPTAGLVTAHMLSLRNNGRHRAMTDPIFAPTAQGTHIAQVQAFLMKYHETGGQHQTLLDPLHTVDSKARFGLVTVHGVDYQIVDIGMRMLTLDELSRGQGLPDGYELRPMFNGKRLTNTSGVAKVGNSVSPPPAVAWIKANPPAMRTAA